MKSLFSFLFVPSVLIPRSGRAVESLNPVTSSVRGSVSAKEGTDCYSLAPASTHTSCGRVNVRMVLFAVRILFFFVPLFFVSCNIPFSWYFQIR